MLKKCTEAGIAALDVLTDAVTDSVDIAEQTSEGVPADFSASEWSDLLQIRKVVDDATASGDDPLRWTQVREFARALLDRYGWHGDIDPNQYLV